MKEEDRIYEIKQKHLILILWEYDISIFRKVRHGLVILNRKQIKLTYFKDKKEEIWPSPMTKAPTPTEMSKGQSDNTDNATEKFD